jgi:hypothetical protein
MSMNTDGATQQCGVTRLYALIDFMFNYCWLFCWLILLHLSLYAGDFRRHA